VVGVEHGDWLEVPLLQPGDHRFGHGWIHHDSLAWGSFAAALATAMEHKDIVVIEHWDQADLGGRPGGRHLQQPIALPASS
jgi:hypothetical protein